MTYRNRLSMAQRRIYEMLRREPSASYNDIAAEIEVDRHTAMSAIKRLEREGRIKTVRRPGQRNQYQIQEMI